MQTRYLLFLILLFQVAFPAAAQRQRIVLEQGASAAGVFGWKDTNGAETTLTIPSGAVGAQDWVWPGSDVGGGGALCTNGSRVITVGTCGGGGSSYYQTMRNYAGTALPQRPILRTTSLAFNIYDDPDGADGDPEAETEVAINSSPFNSQTLVGTGRTLTGTAPVRVSGVSGTPITLAADLVLSMATSPPGATTAVATTRGVTSFGPITVNGVTSTTLATDLSIGCAACARLDTIQQFTAAQTFQQQVTLGGATASTDGSLRVNDDDGFNLVDIKSSDVSGSIDRGEVTVYADFDVGGTSTFAQLLSGSLSVQNPSSNAFYSSTGVTGTFGTSWSYTNSGVTIGGNTFLTSARWVYGTRYYANGVLGTTNTLTCSAGQAVRSITVNVGIVTAVSCGTP